MLTRRLQLGIALASLLCASCATVAPTLASFQFFEPAPDSDPWRSKVSDWQARHALDLHAAEERTPPESELARRYAAFSSDLRRELKRQIAARTVRWIQQESRRVYTADRDEDHWATLGEVLAWGEDDCDGLDLLTFQLLRDFGFQEREILRAIVVQASTGQHHMVTLWFEEGDRNDPFVLDPTGVVTGRMTRLSEIDGWVPIEAFDEHAHYRVEVTGIPASVAGR